MPQTAGRRTAQCKDPQGPSLRTTARKAVGIISSKKGGHDQRRLFCAIPTEHPPSMECSESQLGIDSRTLDAEPCKLWYILAFIAVFAVKVLRPLWEVGSKGQLEGLDLQGHSLRAPRWYPRYNYKVRLPELFPGASQDRSDFAAELKDD